MVIFPQGLIPNLLLSEIEPSPLSRGKGVHLAYGEGGKMEKELETRRDVSVKE